LAGTLIRGWSSINLWRKEVRLNRELNDQQLKEVGRHKNGKQRKRRRLNMFRTNRVFTILLLTALTLSAAGSLAAEASGVVNINTADSEELSLLPRVGPTVAQRIVDFRQENGRFQNLEDLMLVRGIGEKTFELMKPYITLEGQTSLKDKVRPPRESTQDEEQ
jgi:competence protein ComEA